MDKKQFIDLSRYEKLEKIGEGSFGKIYKVKEKETGKFCAAKITNSDFEEFDVNSNTHMKDLIREIDIISHLDHPSILKFIGFSPFSFNKKLRPTIFTEYSSNGSLDKLIQLERKGLSPSGWNKTQKLINIYGIACGMAFLHSNDILHRDLKPENVLEDDSLYPKIADFGLSKQLFLQNSNSMKQTLQIKGTPIYIAPEIWKNYSYTKASDVYAFAITIFEIVTNDAPYLSIKMPEFCLKVVNENLRPKFFSKTDQCYVNLIERCWSENPNSRPTFEMIVNELKNNPEFFTDEIDKDAFYKYSDYLDNYQSSFNDINKWSNLDVVFANLRKLNNCENENNERGEKIVESFNGEEVIQYFANLKISQNFKDFSEETKNFIQNLNLTSPSISIDENQSSMLYLNGSFNSPIFVDVLKQFENISIEIEYSSEFFIK